MEAYLNKLRADAYQRGNHALVFVEDFPDINFWWYLFDHFTPELKPHFPPVSQGGNGPLKTDIFPHLGIQDDIAVCIAWDSDNAALYGTAQQHPFLFETQVYTLENHFCYPEAIQLAIRELTLSDFPMTNGWLEQYAVICYQVLRRMVAFRQSEQTIHFTDADHHSLKSSMSEDVLLPLLEFKQASHQPGPRLTEIEGNIRSWCMDIDQLLESYQIPLNTADSFLSEEGIIPETAFFFISGHIVFDRFVLPLVKQIAYEQREEYKQTLHGDSQRISTYMNQTKADPETKLRDGYKKMLNNPNYPWLGMIGQQLQQAFPC